MAILDMNKIINNSSDDSELGEYKIFSDEEVRKDVKVVFMGTPSFAVPILDYLIKYYNVVLVVCQPDRKKDRKGRVIEPETKVLAKQYGVEVFQPTNIKVEYQVVLDYKPDIIITCAYGQIIPRELIDYPKYGCINVHGSLLPKLRGGAPIHWAIINGDKETGITIMSMSEKMDAGDIISQAKIAIDEDMILDTLYSQMSYLGRDLLAQTMPSILNGTCTYTKQNEALVTFGCNVLKQDEKIDFNKDAGAVRNLVRGLNSVPGAYCYFDDRRMKIYECVVVEDTANTEKINSGTIVKVDNESFMVKCGSGLVKVLEIALEGKKRCLVRDYFNGVKKESLVGKELK